MSLIRTDYTNNEVYDALSVLLCCLFRIAFMIQWLVWKNDIRLYIVKDG